MSKSKTFVIVGASLAGAKAAAELRERGFDGRVVLVGAETERPYERPPLTKDYLRGESEREKAYVHERDFYAAQEIELRRRARWPRSTRTRRPSRWPAARTHLRQPAAHHRGRAPPPLGARRRPRRRPLPAHVRRLRRAARAPRVRRPRGGRRRRLDRQRVRRLRAPARPRGDGHRSARAAQRAHLRPRDRRVLSRRPPRARGRDGPGRRRRRARGGRVGQRVRTRSGRRVECDFAVVGVGVEPRARAGRGGRPRRWRTASRWTPRSAPRRPTCSPPAMSPSLASVLRAPRPGGALGQRAQPGPGRRAGDAR